MLRTIREFFFRRSVLEVETPLLGQAIGTDPQLDYFSTEYHGSPLVQKVYLQTSPEFAMKRLLASGSGSIYQICKAFRNGESGRFHNPEFTLLEWYRIDFDLNRLMDECDELIRTLCADHRSLSQTFRVRYAEIFRFHTGLNALTFDCRQYRDYAQDNQLSDLIPICAEDHATWLDLLFSLKVQPHLGENALWMIYGFPACQSALARLDPSNPDTAERVELFIDGVELGNGFFELADSQEQSRRFNEELALRRKKNLPAAGKDSRLLAALDSGLPDCAGMAIGIDRLLMVLNQQPIIDEVLAFPFARA